MQSKSDRVRELEDKIKKANKELEHCREEVDFQQRNCHHEWGEAKYDLIIQEAYIAPGDPPGTMGVDWRGPRYVPRQETTKWTRQCRICLKTESTMQTDQHVTHTPKFGSRW